MGVRRNENPIKVKLEQLLVVTADRGRNGGANDGRLQVLGRISLLRPSADEELIIDVPRWKRVQREPRVAPQIGALG